MVNTPNSKIWQVGAMAKIYTASFFEPENHHGQIVSIALSAPRGFKIDGCWDLFTPSAELAHAYIVDGMSEDEYIDRYRRELAKVLPKIKSQLQQLDLTEDLTLCGWPVAGKFCVRNLAAKLIQTIRPDLWGGCDVLADQGVLEISVTVHCEVVAEPVEIEAVPLVEYQALGEYTIPIPEPSQPISYEVNRFGTWHLVQRIAPDGPGFYRVQCAGFIATVTADQLRIAGNPEPLIEPYMAAAKRYAEQKSLAVV
jgi:uncharacterized protein YeaO (DUF488 family)